jgi:excisionase family DNA binding protein
MSTADLSRLVEQLSTAIREARSETLPSLAGALAEAQARLQVRLATLGPSPPAAESYLTVQEVALRLRVKPSHVYGRIRRGQLPGIKEGKYVRVPAGALEQVLRQRTCVYTASH